MKSASLDERIQTLGPASQRLVSNLGNIQELTSILDEVSATAPRFSQTLSQSSLSFFGRLWGSTWTLVVGGGAK